MSANSARNSNAAVGCVICGIGGWDTMWVLGAFFGLSTLGFILLFLWSLATKQFKDTNTISDDPLRAEEFASAMKNNEEKLYASQEDEVLKAGHAAVPLWIKILWLFFAVWIIIYLALNL